MALPERLLQAERARREAAAKRTADAIQAALDGLSPKQRTFVLDPALRKTGVTSRQSGKTHSALVMLCTKARTVAGSQSLYIAPSRQAARTILWGRLKQFDRQHGLGFTYNETLLEATAPNGSVIRLSGCRDRNHAERHRGQTLDLVVIDEAAVYSNDLLQYLVLDVLEPALLIKQGSLVLISTPGLYPRGYFHECCEAAGSKWSRHTWTLADNPAIANAEEVLAEKRARNHWTLTTPRYLREYLGQWCADTDSAVYKLHDEALTRTIPQLDFYVIGVDFGWHDATAFSVVGWRQHDTTLYVAHCEAEAELTTAQIQKRMKELRDAYQPIMVVCEPASGGKHFMADFQTRYQVPIEVAEKHAKIGAIAHFNSDLAGGHIKIRADLPLVEQMRALRWHPEHIGTREKEGLPNDMCDATLYAFRKALHFTQAPEVAKPKYGTPEYWAAEEAKIREQHTRPPSNLPDYEQSAGDIFSPDGWPNFPFPN